MASNYYAVRTQRPHPAALDGGVADEVRGRDRYVCIDDLGCTEEDEENEPFIDDDHDNIDDKDFEK